MHQGLASSTGQLLLRQAVCPRKVTCPEVMDLRVGSGVHMQGGCPSKQQSYEGLIEYLHGVFPLDSLSLLA